MPVTEIIVVRHAERNHWLVDTIDKTYRPKEPTPTDIATDPCLTPNGITQSISVAKRMLRLLPSQPTSKNIAIFSSPFYRCIQTIAPTVHSLKTRGWDGRVHLEAGFSEWFGTIPFDHPAPLDAARMQAKFFEFVHPTYQSQAIFPLGPEPYDQLRHRTQVALEAGIAQAEETSEGRDTTLVIVAHTAVVIMLGRILTNSWPIDPSEQDFLCYLAGISQYRRMGFVEATNAPGGPDGNWECVLNSDCSHLAEGPEGGWHFGKKGVQDERVVRGPDGRRMLSRDVVLE